MQLIFIRHGDPDYVHDSLTEKGKREAAILAGRMASLKGNEFYVSPLGRAKETATLAMKDMPEDAIVLPFLEEFKGRCIRPDTNKRSICWDWMPADWTSKPIFFDKDHWFEEETFAGTNIKEEYLSVCAAFDDFMAEHGYVREGKYYRAEKANHDTIVCFCHFAITCVILSHLLNLSPMLLWHGLVAPTTSVTRLVSEERQEKKAYFRVITFGDVSHLPAAGEPVSFAARYAECFEDEERH